MLYRWTWIWQTTVRRIFAYEGQYAWSQSDAYQVFVICIWRTNFPGPIESVISKITCMDLSAIRTDSQCRGTACRQWQCYMYMDLSAIRTDSQCRGTACRQWQCYMYMDLSAIRTDSQCRGTACRQWQCYMYMDLSAIRTDSQCRGTACRQWQCTRQLGYQSRRHGKNRKPSLSCHSTDSAHVLNLQRSARCLRYWSLANEN